MSSSTPEPDLLFPRTLLNYIPTFKTLVPPLHFSLDEVHWMHPVRKSFHQLVIDAELEPNGTSKHRSETCQIFDQACQEALPFSLRQTIIGEIELQPDIVPSFGLTPSNLPGLVKNNPAVATPVLLTLMERGDVTELIDVLVDLELSINTMEVVNSLANNLVPGSRGAALPRPFLHLYISNCISQCAKVTDRYMQNRQARLVCVFLQSLFRNHIIEIQIIPQALLFQIEAFCIEFGRIREATALYSHLKELESAEGTTEAAISKALDEM